MFTPIYLLPQRNINDLKKYEDRWNDNRIVYDKVVELIKNGAGEDFLQSDYENKRLPILENMWDLKGISLNGLVIDFPEGDNFEAIDFTYASFTNCTFTNAFFPSMQFSLARFYNVVFKKCVFAMMGFYGSKFENVTFEECDFIDHSRITNCEFVKSSFNKTFFIGNIFDNCRFDSKTSVNVNYTCTRWGNPRKQMDIKNLSDLYNGIKQAYENGNEYDLSRKYFYMQMRTFRDFNIITKSGKIGSWLLDLITGYGVKPWKTLVFSFITLLVFSIVFVIKLGFSDGLLMSTGAFFTFGAKTDILGTLSKFYKIIYVVESFLGVILNALFVTVCANYWFGKR